MPLDRLAREGFVRRRRLEAKTGGVRGTLVLRLVGGVHAVLKQVERDGEGFQTELFGQPEFAEAEEVFVQVFGKVATDELLATVVEGADAVCACVIAEGGTLGISISIGCIVGGRYVDLRAGLRGAPSSSHALRQVSCRAYRCRP